MRRTVTAWRAGAAAAAACCALVLVTAPESSAKPAAPRTYHVDCAHGRDSSAGTSSSSAWRTLDRAGQTTLRAGDALLLRRGTRCGGVFTANGSGTVRRPIVLGAYGRGARPIVDGGGARAAIVLHDVQGWTVRGLSIRNPGPTTDVGVLRSGIQIDNEHLPVAAGFTIVDNLITDVDTARTSPEGVNALNYSKVAGGIQFNAAAPQGFTDVRIERNTLRDVGREGIMVRGGTPTQRLVIRANTLQQIVGDGIVVVRGSGALVERNVVDGFNLHGLVSNAGIWSYESTDVTFQFNDVSHGANGDKDGMAYDIDGGNRRITFQYNLSRENAGGFIMWCGDPETSDVVDSVVRYNISQNDGDSWHGVIGSPCGPQQGISFYNNTIYTRDPESSFLDRNVTGSVVSFRNNLFVGPGTASQIEDAVATFEHNLFANVTCNIAHPDPHAVIADPGLADPGRARSLATAQGYRLRRGSPAIGAGTPIAGDGGRDFFGNPIPGQRPNIGADQGQGAAPAARGETTSAPGCAAP